MYSVWAVAIVRLGLKESGNQHPTVWLGGVGWDSQAGTDSDGIDESTGMLSSPLLSGQG